ncbi:MAG: PilZ domain-containing protein [Candidatus Omnitrophica bacterium]|nr:PilZ domain-containing protein [Candidatus Omnitrophota bacterium]
MQERRTHIRVTTPVLIEFPHPVTMKTERSFTYDVSEGGLRFPTEVKLPIGRDLPMTLSLPFQNSTFHAVAEVMWVREIARIGATQYEIGVRFRWLEDPDRQRLSHHLRAISGV